MERRDAEAQSLLREVVHNASDAPSENFDVEVDEQPNVVSCYFQIGEQLLLVQWQQLFDRLELKHKPSIDQYIDSALAYRYSLVAQLQRYLSLERNLTLPKLHAES
jgi:hypothetical protein